MEPPADRCAPRHSIGVVVRRTGLRADLIRAWERRYGVVEPARSPTRRRVYSDAEVERLLLVRRAIDGGRSIGDVAALSDPELEELIAGDAVAQGGGERGLPGGGSRPVVEQTDSAAILDACLDSIRRLDQAALEAELDGAAIALSRIHLIDRLLAPLLEQIGVAWRQGTLRPAHEHLASAAVRSFLGRLLDSGRRSGVAPRLVVTTPPRQGHELGALLVAAAAAAEGWEAVYLGAELPVEEIAAAVHLVGARAAALSIVYPPDDPDLGAELTRLRCLLPETAALLVGGRGAPAYRAVLEAADAIVLNDLAELRGTLAALRGPA